MSRIRESLAKSRTSTSEADRSTSTIDTVSKVNGGGETDSPLLDFTEIPTLRPDEDLLIENRVVAVQPDSPARSIYKILRTRILHRMRTSNWNILGVSGSGPGEGKTLTAINLAYSLSHDVNYRVVLLDLDLRRPSVHTVLGMEPRFDLQSYIDGKASLKQALVRPGENRLAVLANMTTHRDSSEVLSSPRIVSLIDELRSLGPNTITIVDLPPVMAGDDVLAFSPLMDALLLVVAEGLCKRQNLAGMQEFLGEAQIIGTVLNRSRERSSTMEYYGYY